MHINVIDEEERELYEYGFYILFSTTYFVLVSLLIGSILEELLASIVFLFTFLPIRQYAGGYHSKTETRCFFLSTTLIVVSVVLIWALQKQGGFWISFLFSVLGVSAILLYAPIDSKEKPLDDTERAAYRKKALQMMSVYVIAIGFAFLLNLRDIYSSIAITLFLQGILLFAARFSKRYNKSIAC